MRGLWDSVEGRFDAAIEAVNRAVAKSPSDAFCWVYRARILVNAERPKETETAIRNALHLSPFHPVNYLALLGDALVLQGKTQEALAVFKEMVTAGSPTLYRPICAWQAYTALSARWKPRARKLRRFCGLTRSIALPRRAPFTFHQTSNARRPSSIICVALVCPNDYASVPFKP